jgi:hypothetical protein
MKSTRLIVLAVLVGMTAFAQQVTSSSGSPILVQPRLVAPGSIPFHLKALIMDKDDPSHPTQVEMFWVAPNRWRRTIESPEFSQILIVDGDKVSEKDSERYMPLSIHTLVTAMVDPDPILKLVRPGGLAVTKASGTADESGQGCYEIRPGSGKICGRSRYGLAESVKAMGQSITFTEYREFAGKRVARRLIYSPEHGYVLNAQIWELAELKNPEASLFVVEEPTPREERIQVEAVSEDELRAHAISKPEIIWPQALDGKTAGKSSFFVSIDPDGIVRDTAIVYSDNERTDDSARTQISKWKFKPVMRDGVAVQVEAVLNFELNTRKYGPAEPLSDAEARQLATNIVEPEFPPQVQGAAATCSTRIAVDVDGKMIEAISGECPREAWFPCYQSLGKWHFSPIMENGQPRPYRAEIKFKVP